MKCISNDKSILLENCDSELQSIVIHESGHAIMGLMQGMKIDSASILKNEESMGRVSHGRLKGELEEVYKMKMLFACAGQAACQLFDLSTAGCRGDVEYVNLCAKYFLQKGITGLALTEKECEELSQKIYRKMYVNAYGLLMPYCDDILFFAKELLNERKLEGKKLKQVIEKLPMNNAKKTNEINLDKIKAAIFRFEDILCVFPKNQEENVISAEKMILNKDYWTKKDCLVNEQIKSFISYCKEKNIMIGFTSCSNSFIEMKNKQCWAEDHYDAKFENFCVAEHKNIYEMMKWFCDAYGYAEDEVLIVENTSQTACAAKVRGYQACTYKEIE